MVVLGSLLRPYHALAFSPVNRTRHELYHVEQILKTIKKWLVTPTTFTAPWAYRAGLVMIAAGVGGGIHKMCEASDSFLPSSVCIEPSRTTKAH